MQFWSVGRLVFCALFCVFFWMLLPSHLNYMGSGHLCRIENLHKNLLLMHWPSMLRRDAEEAGVKKSVLIWKMLKLASLAPPAIGIWYSLREASRFFSALGGIKLAFQK